MADIDVTVVVPCYNTERYLDQALATLLRNDCALEIIVVNDGSTDGSLAIMRNHERKDPRIRVIDKQNEGYGASVNRGFSEAKGTYVTVLEPDDYVQPHFYDTLFDEAKNYGMPDIVKSSYWRIVNADTELERAEHCYYFNGIYVRKQPFTILDEPSFLRHHPSIWSAIYRRDFLRGHDIRFKELPGAGWVDNPFMVETLCQADSIVYLNEPFYCYREFLPGSSSDITLSTMPFERWHDMADILERLGITDDGVWDALYIREFDCIVPQVELGGLEEEPYASAIRSVCERMDPERVRRLPVLTPHDKEVYYQIRGLELPKGIKRTFLFSQLADFGRTLTYYGPRALSRRIGGVIRRGGRVD